jgi:hypothetical protein
MLLIALTMCAAARADASVRSHAESLLPGGHAASLQTDEATLSTRLRQDVETPLLIWNQALRAELVAHVEATQAAVQAGSWVWGDEHMVYAGLAKEVCVRGVYLRVLVAQPTAVIPTPNLLAADLATALAGGALAPEVAALYATALSVLLASRPEVTTEVTQYSILCFFGPGADQNSGDRLRV